MTEPGRNDAGRSYAERRMARALELNGVGWVDWDLETNAVELSDVARRIYGWAPEQPVTADMLAEIVHPDDTERAMQHVNDATSGLEVGDLVIRIVQASGAVRWTRTAFSIETGGGHRSLLGTLTDITDLKAAEEEREALAEQVRETQKMEAIGRLAAGVAHDFNNTLCVISTLADTALRSGELSLTEGERPAEDIRLIGAAVKSAARLTRQLLAVSRRQVVADVVLDVNDAVAKAIELVRPMLGEDIEVLFQPSAESWRTRFDPGNLEQVVLNLCANARDAMPEGGRITIRTRTVTEPREGIVLSVRDDGAGMDDESLSRIFEPFFTTKEEGKGTGLGMWSVQSIVKQGGAEIDVRSEKGEGTIVEILFPREVSPVDEVVHDEATRTGSETLLLAEDDIALRTVLKRALAHAGYVVIESGRVSDAVRVADAHAGPIHMLLTDLIMPDGDGAELAAELRQRHGDLRVLYMSGYAGDRLSSRGLHVRGTELISKPFTIADLMARIRRVLDDPPVSRAS